MTTETRRSAFGRFRVGGVAGEMCKLNVREADADTQAKACEWVKMDAASGAQTVTAPNPREGVTFAVRKEDASGNVVTVADHEGAPLIELAAEDDTAVYRYTDGSWELVAADLADATAADFGIPSLAPTLYGPLAQWALGDNTGVILTDRSGNDRHLTQLLAPNRVPDQRVHCFAASNGRWSQSDAVFRITGEFTIALRAWGTRKGQTLLQVGGIGESPDTNVLYQFGTISLDNAISYFFERGSGSNNEFTSSLIPVLGKWQYFCFRRAASGVVTIDLDYDTQTSGALPLPEGGSGATLYLGHDANSGFEWQGGLSDVSIWGARLTDTQLLPIKKALMAIP